MSAFENELNTAVGCRAIDLTEKGAIDELRELLADHRDVINTVKDWVRLN
jgi:hypothetical protein